MFKSFVAVALLAAVVGAPVEAQKGRRGEQDAAFQATHKGAVRSLRSIENCVVPAMEERGQKYIGAEFYEQDLRYRLKFMQGSKVIWVDVDGSNCEIIGKVGD